MVPKDVWERNFFKKKLEHLIVTDDACQPRSQEGLQLQLQKKWEFPVWPWWLLYHEIFFFMVLKLKATHTFSSRMLGACVLMLDHAE